MEPITKVLLRTVICMGEGCSFGTRQGGDMRVTIILGKRKVLGSTTTITPNGTRECGRTGSSTGKEPFIRTGIRSFQEGGGMVSSNKWEESDFGIGFDYYYRFVMDYFY